ncbi:unnamed protein product, partial [Iphiclides podalirius]
MARVLVPGGFPTRVGPLSGLGEVPLADGNAPAFYNIPERFPRNALAAKKFREVLYGCGRAANGQSAAGPFRVGRKRLRRLMEPTWGATVDGYPRVMRLRQIKFISGQIAPSYW